MQMFMNLLPESINPFIPLGKYIYGKLLGRFVKTDDGADYAGFMGNGLSNINLDPQKVNKFLIASPLKLVSGSLSEIKLSIEVQNKKIAVTVGQLNLVTYVDHMSQYEHFRQEIDTMQLAEELDDEETGGNNSQDGTPSLIDKILSSFELQLQWKGVSLEIQLGKAAADNARFFVSVSNISAKKLKKANEMVIHQLVASIGTLTADFCRAGEHNREKMLSVNMVEHEGKAVLSKHALEVGLDIMKEVSSTTTAQTSASRFTIVRANVGTVQAVLTLQCILELVRLMEKVAAHSQRNLLMQKALLHIARTWKQDSESKGENIDYEDAEYTEEMFKSVVSDKNVLASFVKPGNGLETLGSLRLGSFRASPEAGLLQSAVIQQPADIAKDIINKEIQESVQKGSVDLEFNLQGIFIAFLKIPTFDMSNNFNWRTKIARNESLEFRDLVGNHFLLFSEDIQFQYLTKSADGKRLLISTLGLRDYLKLPNQSFRNRVDIHGLDESQMPAGSESPSFFSSSDSHPGIVVDDDELDFRSVIEPSKLIKYEVVDLLQLDKLVKVHKGDPSAVIIVKFNFDNAVPEVAVKICTIKVKIDLNSFTLLANRQEFANLLQSTAMRARNQKGPTMSDYGHISEKEVADILSDLEFLLAQTKNEYWRKELLKLFSIPDPKLITTENSMKLTVDINQIVVRAGGELGLLTGNSVWAILELGSISVLLQKQIVVTWRQDIDLYLLDSEKRYKFVTILVNKENRENLVAIDQESLITKITGINVNLSPEIFKTMLILIDLSNNKIKKLDYSQQRFKILDSIAELRQLQAKHEVRYQQELLINQTCNDIMLKLLEVPPLVSSSYVFIGCISLHLNDEEITQELLMSLKSKQKVRTNEVWESIEEDGSSSIIEAEYNTEVEDKRARKLQEMNVVIQLDIKPVMMKITSGGEMAMMIHTIQLRDGMTALSMEEDKMNYKTHFCELYSINYNQARYDAKLASVKFCSADALKYFKQVMNYYNTKGPFLDLQKTIDHFGKANSYKMHIKFSSLVFRLSLGTNRDTFICLIKIVDKTVGKLNELTAFLEKLQQTQETQEEKDFRKKAEQSVLESTNPLQPQKTEASKPDSSIRIELDTISVDLFNEGKYRMIMNINKTNVELGGAALEFMKGFAGRALSDKPSYERDPAPNLAVSIEDAKILFSEKPDMTGLRSLDTKALEEYYKLLLLPQAHIVMSSKVQDEIPRNFTNVYLHSLKDDKPLYIQLDIFSISVLMQIMENLDGLIESAKKKTKNLFVQTFIVKEKSAAPDISEYDEDEFIVVGEKNTELTTVEKQIDNWITSVTLEKEWETIPHTSNDLGKDDQLLKEKLGHKKIGEIQGHFVQNRKVIDACHVEGLRRGRQFGITSIHLDRLVFKLVQKYDVEETSSLSLQLKKVICILQAESSFEDDRKRADKKKHMVTNSLALSVQSVSIRDNTSGGKFKYLLKLPKHSLYCFFRSRVTTEENSKPLTPHEQVLNELTAIGSEISDEYNIPKPVIESKVVLTSESTDKLALVVKLSPIYVSVDDKSLNSLWSFSQELKAVLDRDRGFAPSQSSQPTTLAKQPAEPVKIMIDYVSVDAFEINIISLASTNLSLLAVVPNLTLKISPKLLAAHNPLTWDELIARFQEELKEDYSPAKLLKANKLNIPIVASFVSLVGGFTNIYNSITRQDGSGVVQGFYEVLMVGFVSCANIGLFGLKSIADLISLIGRVTHLAPGNRTLGSVFKIEKLQNYLEKWSIRPGSSGFRDMFR